MTRIVEEVLAANEAYAATFGDKANLPLTPGRRFAILTCMDARLDLSRAVKAVIHRIRLGAAQPLLVAPDPRIMLSVV